MTADTVKRYVDENIAHSDARRTAAVATFNDLDAGIDAIGDLYAKYTLALTAVGYVTLVR